MPIPNQQDQSTRSTAPYPDELTLKEFLIGLVDMIRWLKVHWWKMTIIMALCSAALLYYQWQQAPQYPASLTLILADDHSGSMGGLGSVLGQFGLPSSSGKYNIDKLLKVAKARRIAEGALLTPVSMDNRKDYLANFFIELYDLDGRWANTFPEMVRYRISNHDKSQLTDKDHIVIKQLHRLIVGAADDYSDGLLQMSYGKTDYVMSFEMKALHPDIAIHTVNLFFQKLKEYYVFQATEKYQTSYNVLKQNRDSIARAWQASELRLAQLKDQSAATFEYRNSVLLNNIATQSMGLKLALAEIEKSLSIAEIALKNSTPMIQLIDSPVRPISPIPRPFVKTIILGSLVGIGLYMALLFIRMLLRLV